MNKEGWFIIIKLDKANQPNDPSTQGLDWDGF